MQLSGRVQNGVVVLDDSVSLPEGAAVTEVLRKGTALRVAKNQKRIESPLVPSDAPGSVRLTNEMIGEILVLGTELTPDVHINAGGRLEDWTCAGGDFDFRLQSSGITIASVSTDERNRVARTAASKEVKPNIRYHYRYIAANLAWASAQLMPDDSEKTARVLCEAGGWLKASDAETADRFYKALVLRCPHTSLGREAIKNHWFPELPDKALDPTTRP